MKGLERRFNSIEEIPLPVLMRGSRGERYYGSVDPHIANLVRAIRGLGYETESSCEGHLEETKAPLPWIGIREVRLAGFLGSSLYRWHRLVGIIGYFNRQSAIRWTTIPRSGEWAISGLGPRISASNQEELQSLQQSGETLAQFLFEKYLKKTP